MASSRQAWAVADDARNSSSTSGLRFCGMIDEPEPESVRKPDLRDRMNDLEHVLKVLAVVVENVELVLRRHAHVPFLVPGQGAEVRVDPLDPDLIEVSALERTERCHHPVRVDVAEDLLEPVEVGDDEAAVVRLDLGRAQGGEDLEVRALDRDPLPAHLALLRQVPDGHVHHPDLLVEGLANRA